MSIVYLVTVREYLIFCLWFFFLDKVFTLNIVPAFLWFVVGRLLVLSYLVDLHPLRVSLIY